jgi:autotransporter-associated beta strand protein
MAGGTHISSDGGTARTIHKALAINGGIGMAVLQPGTLNFNNTVNLGGADRALTNSNAVIINGQISNGGIIKDGVGTMTINSNNTYTGQTLVLAGEMVYAGTNTSSQTGVGSAGYLYGLGSLGNLTITGQVSAGTASNTVGSLRSTNLFLASNGRLQVNFANAGNMNGTAGTDWDLLTVNGGSGTYTGNSSSGGSEFVIALKGTPTFNTSLGYTNIIVDAGTASSFAANKFTVDYTEFNGGAVGGGSFTVDADSGNLRLIFAPAVVSAPDILVQGLGVTIPDGDTTPAYTDDTDFGDLLVVGGLATKTYTITNSGSAALGIGNVYTNAGGNTSEFVVSAQPGSFNLAAGATTTFQVQFNPTNSGLRFADFEFTNNVSGAKNPYTFRVQGTGTYVEVAVSGLGNNIADGDATPSGTDGTDFGSVALTSGTQPRTFVITNSGNRTLTISGGITTSGTHAADFQITTAPSTTIAPSGSTSFVVTFDPSAVGTRSATINFSNNDDSFSDGLTESSFDFAVQGFGVAPSITTFPTSLNFSSVLGTAPATQTFSITNNGLGSMTWTLSTNVTWLSVSNVTGSAAAGAGQVHTAYVGVLAGQVAGTSNATITVTSAEATNSTKTITVQWTISPIPDPSAQTATADGNEMVRLRWTKDASYNVMVIHKGTNAPSVPANGTAYSLGHTFADGSRVIAFSTATNHLEHIVAAGSTNYYAFYSMNGNYYSPGVSANVTMGTYGTDEIVDVGAYTNGVAISTLNKGNGWSGGWTTSGSGTWVAETNYSLGGGSDIPGLQSPVNYPAQKANRFTISSLGNDQSAFARKTFTALTTGQVYIAGIIAYRYPANNKYMGISFMNGSVETGFVGKAGGNTVLAIDTFGGTKVEGSTAISSTQSSTNNAYLVVAKYDFSTKQIQANVYLWTATVPTTEPVSWEATATVPGNGITQIDGVRVGGGAFSGESISAMWFDEVRVATNWASLLRLTQPVATAYAINGGSNVTDGQIVDGSYSTVFDFYDTAGITNTSTLPNYDIWNSTGTRILTNQTFASKVALSGGATMRASNTSHTGASGAAVVLGVYTSRWTAANSNGVQVSNSDSLSNGTKTVFTVVDDDTAVPNIMTTHSPEIGTARNMHVTTNGVGRAPDGGSTTNIRYSLTDGYLANQISGGAPLIFYFGARDAGSGLSRGNGSASTNSSLTIGSAVISNTFNWDVTRSSAFTNTYDASATNVWSWIGALLPDEIANLVTNTTDGYGTNKVTLTWRDNDFDRTGDQSTLYDQQHGYLIVADDDLTAPVITNNFRAFGRALNGGTFTNDEFVAGFSVTGSVGDAFSGLFAGASNTLVVKYQDGSTVTSGIWSTTFANGANGALSNTFVHAHLSAVGVYTMSVTVVDYDVDRANDSLSTTSNFVFTVVNAPTVPGLAVGPLTLNYSAMLGSAADASSTFSVTNVGQSGTLLYTNYQSYGVGASGWFSANPTNNSLAIGSSRVHTGWVGSASITSVGTYYATNRVDGNQTNAAALIQVILTVTNIPNPSSVTATRDGAEMVRLTAAEAAGRTVLVVYAQSNAPSASPVNGTGYTVGSTLGNGTVVFKFTGSASVSNLEHVVPVASTNFYAFYTVNNDRYSTGVVVGATNSGYLAYEKVDQFGYTNGVPLQGVSGGQGWTNAWSVLVPDSAVDAVIDGGSFSTFQNYWPSEAGNRFIFKTTNSSTHAALRNIAPVTGGKLYVAALYRRQFNEGATDAKFSGLRFMGHTFADVVAFVGERGTSGNDDIFGVSTSVGGGGGNTYGGADSFPAGIDYLLIGRYDFDTDIMAGIYYTAGDTIPEVEPTFFVETTNSAITEIRGVSMVAGASSGWNGEVHFDELRVATNWYDLLLRERLMPYATNYLVNGGSDVTDAQLVSGEYGVRVNLRSQAGMESTNTISPFFLPNFDLLNPTGTEILTDRVFSAFSYQDGGATLVASNASHAGAVPASVTLGVYTMRWSAVASNGNVAINVPALSNGTAQAFTVVDDDTTAPSIVNIYSAESGASRRMHVSTNNAAVSALGGTSDTNITYVLFDNALTNISGGSPLVIYFGARDAGSGLNRGNSSALTNSSLTIGSAVISNVFNWDATRSSAYTNTYDATATSSWSWVGAFLGAEIDALVTNATHGLGTNRVTVTWRDNDADRDNDQSTLFDQQHGWLVVRDDDPDGPTYSGFNIYGIQGSYTVRVDELTSGTGWAITGRLNDAVSGINVNGSISNQPDHSPYFELWDSAGNLKLRKTFATIPFGDGGATVLTTVSNGPVALSGVSVGTWTARVVAADNDEDRPNDRAITTNEFAFRVISGDAFGGIGRGPATLVVTSYYGAISGGAPWPNFYVTNIGSGTLVYSNTITYGSAGGWLSVAPVDVSLTGSGASQTHTAAVNSASLNPGTYTATITINGDQTNSAQTIAVTLHVFGFYAGEIVDQFTNTVAASLNGLTGGTGWTNAWSSSPSGSFSIDSGNHTVPGNYPAAAGNKVCGNSASEIQSYRYFPAFSTGKVFVAATIQKNANNNNGFAGLSFYNGSSEVGFVGKLYGQEWFGIDNTNGTTASTFGLYQNQYFIVGMYDFSNKVMYARAYNSGETLSLTQPSSWHAVNSNYVVSQVDGIRIAGKEVGTLCFDEIRVASSWEGLLNVFTNEPTVHAASLSFRDVTTNSMVVGWTPGNGANRIVVAREGSAVTFSPTDSVAYAFSTDFSLGTDLGSGNKVIYNGSGTNVSLTGLNEATLYYFRVYEYNGAGSTANYFTNAGVLAGSRWTLGTEPATGLARFDAYQSSTSAISNTWLLGSTILLDLGRHDGGVNGDTTASPDNNGNYWNNIGPTGQLVTNGTKIVNMVNVMNGATTVGLEVTSEGLQCNGILNGGLLNPSPALLGILAITNATKDYFFTTNTHTFKVTGLNTASTYSLTFFGSRDSTETRTTTYTVGSTSVTLTTSGTGVGAGGVNYNNNNTAVLRALAPNGSGELSVTMTKTGQFGYLNMLKIEEETQVNGFLILRQANGVPTNRPSDGVGYTNGQYVSTSVVATVVTQYWQTTVLHTGLQNCTPYYFTIYPYRQPGAAETLNYLLSGALTSTATTACGEPDVQASNIVFSLVATNAMTVTWQNGNGDQRLVVVRGTNAVNADPVDNTSYTANTTYGSGSHLGNGNYVVYSGTGTSVNVQGLLAGQTYHFRVYEFIGTGGGQNYNTNTAVNNPRSADTASFSLVDDKFVWNYFGSYANNNLSGAGTGSGWTNSWTTFGGYVAVDDANMPAFKGYPADTRSGCGISCDDSRQVKIVTVSGTSYGARRNFPARTGGQLFGAIKFNVASLPSGSFFGISLLNGTSETGFVGKAWGVSDARLTIEHNGTQSVTPTTSTNTYTINTGTGNDYLLVFEYDFDSKVMRARAYSSSQLPHALPVLELGWAVEMTNVNISRIDGIRLAGENVGDLYFDHIRLGPSWEQVVYDLPLNWHQDYGPVPTLVYIGTNYGPSFYSQVITNLSDAELKDAGKIDFAVRWDSSTYGIFLTNNVATNLNIGSPNARVSPNWDPLAVSNLLSGGGATNQFNLDRYFTNYFGRNGDLVVTTYQFNAFNITNINFDDQYFVTVSAETYHNGSPTVTAPNGATWDNVPVQRAITINEALRFYVYDDDTNQPLVGSSRPLRVMTNGVLAGSQDFSGLDRYRVYDGMITQLGLQVSANIYDAYSGLQRSSSGAEATNLNITIDQFVTNNASEWSASLSSALTTNTASTSVWSFAASAFTYGVVSALWGGDGTDSQGQDLSVLVTAPDADDDRAADVLTSTNVLLGYIRVVDDDDQVPFATNTAYGGVSGSRLFATTTNSTPATLQDRGGTGLDVVYNLTDEELVEADSRHVRFAFGAIDMASGLSRGTSGSTNNVMSFSLLATNGAVLVANNMSHYDASQSSPAGAGVIATSVWSFTGSHIFNETLVNNMMTNGLAPNTYVNTNRVTLSAVDADNDRTNDAEAVFDLPVGQITVRDDDRLAPNVGGMTVMGSGGIVVPSDLYISEYVEGSSNNKYIEIFNGTGGSVNLADYALGVYFNGNMHFTGVNNPAYMSGTLGNGATYILANDDAVIWAGTVNQTIGATFNGNDAVVLVKKVGLVTNIIDTLGVIGENANWLQDVTAVRRGSVTGPSSTWVSNDWSYLSQDVLGGLGGHSAADPVTDGDLATGGLVVLTGTVQDVTSGIYAQSGDPRAPRRSLKSNTGLTLLADGEFTHKPSSNGDAMTPESLWEDALGPVNTNNVTLGVYTAIVSAVDYDIDRPSFGDNITNRFPVSFSVVDDDTAGPTAATNVTSTHEAWTNMLSVTVRWSTNSVVDPSGVSLWRVSTNVPVAVTNGALVASGSSTQGSFSLTIADEGITTNLLWAVDADGDRPLDQMYGTVTGFVTKLDITVPLALANVSNDTTDAGVDETEELKVAWTAAADEATAAGKRGDGTALSPWSSYIVTYHELNDLGVELNTGTVTAVNGPTNLAAWNTTSMIISNLDFDSTYRVRIAGRDEAGNIGPETVVTGETVRFVVTQGLARVEGAYNTSNQVDVYWLASTNKVYDVLYTDATSLRDNLTNTWKLLSTVTNSWMFDNGGTGPDGDVRVGPALNQSTLRFYRVSRKDVWRTNNAVRRASVEIYAAKSVRLVPGENWVSLFATPDTSTVAYVLGTNRLVGGTSIVDSPKISWFTSTSGGTTNQTGVATSVIYFASSGNWLYWTGGVGSANQKLMPQNQAFLFELPPGAATQNMVIIGLVPTQSMVHVIGGNPISTTDVFHVLSYTFPQRTRIIDAGFVGSGMVGHDTRPLDADEVRVLKNRNGIGSLEQPRARLRLNAAGTSFIFNSKSTNPLDYVDGVVPGSANNFIIEPDDAVIVVRRNSSTMNWTNRPSYTPPGKNINP